MECRKCGFPTYGDNWLCDDCKDDFDRYGDQDEECEECGGINENHKAWCSQSGSSYYLLITEGYD